MTYLCLLSIFVASIVAYPLNEEPHCQKFCYKKILDVVVFECCSFVERDGSCPDSIDCLFEYKDLSNIACNSDHNCPQGYKCCQDNCNFYYKVCKPAFYNDAYYESEKVIESNTTNSVKYMSTTENDEEITSTEAYESKEETESDTDKNKESNSSISIIEEDLPVIEESEMHLESNEGSIQGSKDEEENGGKENNKKAAEEGQQVDEKQEEGEEKTEEVINKEEVEEEYKDGGDKGENEDKVIDESDHKVKDEDHDKDENKNTEENDDDYYNTDEDEEFKEDLRHPDANKNQTNNAESLTGGDNEYEEGSEETTEKPFEDYDYEFD